ncbi:RNase H domain-containing protein [Trichonephila clavipes]|nr:RNase H domain-containing protein [Trichonephila clavipes]
MYQAIVLSRIDYGCVVYGSMCNSTLKKLDPVHHMALKICSGAFRTSPVQSLYVNCNQLTLDFRRRKLSLAYYFKILSVPSHPLENVYMSTSMKRLYDARPSNIRPFMDRMKLLVSELDLPNVNIQQRNVLQFQPWNTPRLHYINPFASYSKSIVVPVVFQRVFAFLHSQYRMFSAIYTDDSKRADYVGCGVVIEDITHGYRLDPSCSVFTAEAVAIYRALQSVDSNMPRKYCIYTDSMSVLEALENYNDRCHPGVCNVFDITSRLYSKGFDIFCSLPSHVGIIGNEQADSAARSATTHLPLTVPLSDMKHVILHPIFTIWQESWSQQLDNKLHSVKPVIGAWPVMLMRRTDVKLTLLHIGHTRFTHRHLLLGEDAPECPSFSSLERQSVLKVTEEIKLLLLFSVYGERKVPQILSFSYGAKTFPIFTECIDAEAPPQHLLDCVVLVREDFSKRPILFLDFLRFGLAIHQNDHQARRRFVEWAQNEIAVVPDFHKRILFSDEAHFWLNGYVNKQNCRIWSEANPQVYVERPLHPEKLTVWCALWAGGIIGPYFFKNDEGHKVTVNGDRYRAMITNFFIPELNNNDVQELWFQQDGATCHTARATIDLLKDTFGDRLISRFGPVNWPPRSCDLTPLDYFL